MQCEVQQAIDMHAHYGMWKREGEDCPRLTDRLVSADAARVAEIGLKNNTPLTVVSPLKALVPRGRAKVLEGNEEAARDVAATDGLLQWVVVNPLEPATYEQAAEMLQLPKCVGMKIHPEEHCYPISAHGRALFEFAAEHGALVTTHSGEPNSRPEAFVPFANDFPEVQLILAHLGHTDDDDHTHHVRAIQQCRHNNVFVDTSSAINIFPGLLEWAVGEIGADRLLYGTDSPLYFVPMQRARIDHAEISEEEKKMILHDNSAALLGSIGHSMLGC